MEDVDRAYEANAMGWAPGSAGSQKDWVFDRVEVSTKGAVHVEDRRLQSISLSMIEALAWRLQYSGRLISGWISWGFSVISMGFGMGVWTSQKFC
jgi:hypothetical protein